MAPRFFNKKRIEDKSRRLADDESYDPEAAGHALVKSHKKGFGLLRRIRADKSHKEVEKSILGAFTRCKCCL